MANKRIAIIGGGIAGLSSLHYLAKHGVSADLFEANNHIGGRICSLHSSIELGAYVFHEHYYTLLEIIADMELSAAIQEKHLGQAGFLKNNNLILLNPKKLLSSIFTKKLSWKDVYCLFQLLSSSAKNYRLFFEFLRCYGVAKEAVSIIEFAQSNIQVASQYKQLFLNKNTRHTADVLQCFISPVCRKLLFQNPDELNLLVGHAIFGAKTFKLKTLKGGLSILTNRLFSRYQNNIHLSSRVTEIKHGGNNFILKMNQHSKEYDYIVYAAPEFTGTTYAKGSVTVVTGTLKNPFNQCDTLFLNDEEGVVNGVTKCENNYYNIYSMNFPTEKELNLDRFFSFYEIVHRKEWTHAVAKNNLPLFENNHFSQKNIFHVGDFLSPSMEVSALTGKKAALQILGSV